MKESPSFRSQRDIIKQNTFKYPRLYNSSRDLSTLGNSTSRFSTYKRGTEGNSTSIVSPADKYIDIHMFGEIDQFLYLYTYVR